MANKYDDEVTAAYLMAALAHADKLRTVAAQLLDADERSFKSNAIEDELWHLARRTRQEADNVISNLIRWSDSFTGQHLIRAKCAVGWDKFTIAHPDL